MRSSINPIKEECAPALLAGTSISQTYRFGMATTEVSVDDPETARWLEEFLLPWFSTGAPDEPALKVCFTSSRERFLALASLESERHPRPLACFRLDRRIVSCPGWVEPNGAIVAADKEFGCYYLVHDDRVEVISRPQYRPARIALMRVVRELTIPRALSQQARLDLHAAAFVFRGRAIILAGDKCSGKTTLLAHALTSPQTGLLANDRVIFDGRLEARGVPTVVSVRQETEREFPALARIFPRHAARFHAGELAPPVLGQASAHQQSALSLSLAQFARQLNSRVEPSAPVGAVLFPEISPTPSSWSLSFIDPTEAAPRLRGNIYGGTLAPTTETIFTKVTRALPGANEPDSIVDRLAAKVPMIRCVLGKWAYGVSSDGWLNALPIDDGVLPQ